MSKLPGRSGSGMSAAPTRAGAGAGLSDSAGGITLRGDQKNKIERAINLIESGSKPSEIFYTFRLPQCDMSVLAMRVDGRYWSATLFGRPQPQPQPERARGGAGGLIDAATAAFNECWRPSESVPPLDYVGQTKGGTVYMGLHLNHVQYMQHFRGRVTASLDALVSWVREYAANLHRLGVSVVEDE